MKVFKCASLLHIQNMVFGSKKIQQEHLSQNFIFQINAVFFLLSINKKSNVFNIEMIKKKS